VSRTLRRSGFGIMGLYSLFMVAMLYGDVLTDPGGWKGFVMVFLPTLAFAFIALVDRWRPRAGRALLVGLAALAVGYHAAIGS
jgi:lipopolysaccharide export LptBFGC system permease protein LptF